MRARGNVPSFIRRPQEAKAAKESREERMNKTIGMIGAPAVAMTLADAALLAGVLLSLAGKYRVRDRSAEQGHDALRHPFRISAVDERRCSRRGLSHHARAVGTTENLKDEKMLDKMSARCQALSVDSGAEKYIDTPVCWPTPTATRSSRPSTRVISISRSLI
jgi:hypothetical protein